MAPITAFPLIVLFFLFSSFSVEGCPPHELEALLRFKSESNGTLNSWNEEHDCCKWIGVECQGTQDGTHVSKLDLGGHEFFFHSVSGKMYSSLFELRHLNFLELTGNFREIPNQFGTLSSLRHLGLSNCEFEFECYLLCGRTLISSSLHWLSNLSSLEYLSLSGVKVSDKNWGRIIGSLHHLKHLDLSGSSLPSPSIPTALVNLSSLTFLVLRGNSFSEIPNWMGKLSSLIHLDLSNNSISGSIPYTIGNLTSLENLDLSRNHLSASLPLSLFHLSSLIHLDLNGNHLNGSIPSMLMLPSSIQELVLSNNNMNGAITEVFFQKLFKLTELDLSHSGLSVNISSTWIPPFQLSMLYLKNCQIGGPIPNWIITQSSLFDLDLSVNQLTGNLPSWLWDIGVTMLSLSDNHLQSSFAPTPTRGFLFHLDLSMNELSGSLPGDIHMLYPNLMDLILADNKFEGKIPTSIANLRGLHFLDLSNNCLTGKVSSTLGNLTSLNGLHLENNYLEGEIPKELSSLSDLLSLRIGKNNLEGFLPSSLTNLSMLEVLDVGENNLTGDIPHWIANFSILHVLVMRSNNFRGILLPDIGGMPMLQVLDLSSNFFSGMIPHSYLRFPAMQNSHADGKHLRFLAISYGAHSIELRGSIDLLVKGMERHYEYIYSDFVCLDLSDNMLTGPLPSEIGNLKGLMNLNLSLNSLSGPIPESLGNLVQLESVDLSSNKFSGQIPWQLGNLTYLGYLNLSYNNLSGRIPRQGQMLTLTLEQWPYVGNPNLWGCPLQRNCFHRALRASPPPSAGVKKREEAFQFPWYWMWYGLAVGLGFSGVVLVLVYKLSWRSKCFEAMDRVIEVMDRGICKLKS